MSQLQCRKKSKEKQTPGRIKALNDKACAVAKKQEMGYDAGNIE